LGRVQVRVAAQQIGQSLVIALPDGADQAQIRGPRVVGRQGGSSEGQGQQKARGARPPACRVEAPNS
jgi:hypothetical protein